MSDLPKILVVEDNDFLCRGYSRSFSEFASQVLVAQSPSQAKRMFDENPDIKLITLDGTLRTRLDGVELAIYFREKGFKGSMIAASSSDNDKLLKAGCNHDASTMCGENIYQLVPRLLKEIRLAAPAQPAMLETKAPTTIIAEGYGMTAEATTKEKPPHR